MKNNHVKVQVCFHFFFFFFLAAFNFNISEMIIRNIMKKRSESDILQPDMKGQHMLGTKRPEIAQIIKDHIGCFPKVVS